MIELPKPQLGILTKKGLVSTGVEDPKQSAFLFVTITAKQFRDHAKYEFGTHEPFKTGHIYWTGGMQSRIADEIVIFTDDVDSGLFALAYFCNNPKYPFMFAKLKDCPLADQIKELFTK